MSLRTGLAIMWLAAVAIAAAYFGSRLLNGLPLQSDILALLPPLERDQALGEVQKRVEATLARRVVLLVSHRDAVKAKRAALLLARGLQRSNLVRSMAVELDPKSQKRIASAYFPFRTGLLSKADRTALLAHQGRQVVDRAEASFFTPGAIANAKLVKLDPFLLFPRFLLGLPGPQSRLEVRDGVLSTKDHGITYVLLSFEVNGDPYSAAFQSTFGSMFRTSFDATKRVVPGIGLIRAGAIFYASEGTTVSMNESSRIGLLSTLGTILLIYFVFRRLRPLVLSLVAILVGLLWAFVGTLLAFGSIHVIALIFGASLIGISVDYCLQYFCEYFDSGARTPRERLRRVLSGVLLGLGTTIIGYVTLFLAPFPGLKQIALFSVAGLLGAVTTILLWYPILDKVDIGPIRPAMLRLGALHWSLWQSSRARIVRIAIVLFCLAAAVVGFAALKVDDDVRHMQSLSPPLRQEEAEMQRLTGAGVSTSFLIVRGSNEQQLLETEEGLDRSLSALEREGEISQFQSLAQYVPSVAMQRSDRALVQQELVRPYLTSYLMDIGFNEPPEYSAPQEFLTPSALPAEGPLTALRALDVGGEGQAAHVVLLSGVAQPNRVAGALKRQGPAVTFVNLTSDWSALFGIYRYYALALLIVSAVLMYPALAWRYGFLAGIRVMFPAIAATGLAPLVAALADVRFTFFNAMALILVLSIGVDYSVFCRETFGERKPVTSLAIALAAASTILGFGLLALSSVFAVHAFGITILIGILLSFLLAPLAGDATPGPRSAA